MNAIDIQDLGKRYSLTHEPRERYTALRDVMAQTARELVRKVSAPFTSRSGFPSHANREDLWALRHVSFEVKQGETVGIIGRNGAGKSTLLKILSRITEPTEGRVCLRGRAASLLEVGTGFHPELTGRENIRLNGAILGMGRGEIRAKFDEIVAFAEVERFLDTPVKRYSSGMFVRLAFAVAAHLDPDILLVDEVLAVGDSAFQKKCLGRMDAVAKEGRTVLFVSHNMGAVKRLCSKCYLLDSGMVAAAGNTHEVVETYLSNTLPHGTEEQRVTFDENRTIPFSLQKAAITDEEGMLSRHFHLGEIIAVEVEYTVREEVRDGFLILKVSRNGTDIFQSHDTDLHPERLELRGPGTYKTRVRLPRRLLTAGRYSVSLKAVIGPFAEFGHDEHPDVLSFDIDEEGEETAYKGHAALRNMLVIAELDWQTEKLREAEGAVDLRVTGNR